MNRDEALRCVGIAREAFQNGDLDKAKRLVNKSLSMYHTESADQLQKEIDEKENPTQTKQQENNNKQTNNEKTNQSGFFGSLNSIGSMFNVQTTKEEEEGNKKMKINYKFLCIHSISFKKVNRILSCNSHYQVLEIEQTANSSDVKRAYFKYARKLHPDKNVAKVYLNKKSEKKRKKSNFKCFY